jgi:hypothetical protein
MGEPGGKKMGEPGKNPRKHVYPKFLAKIPSDWEELSAEERRAWAASLGEKLRERFRHDDR